MINALITSKTRLKIILKFFLNPANKSYLRNLSKEFNLSTNSIRQELDRFEEAKLLKSEIEGNRKYFKANTKHPLFEEVHNLIFKEIGFNHIIDKIIKELGEINEVFVTGNFAEGKDNDVIDLLIVANDIINNKYLIKLISKSEKTINRKISYRLFDQPDFEEYQSHNKDEKMFLLWKE